jgi:translocation and assembly module TamB
MADALPPTDPAPPETALAAPAAPRRRRIALWLLLALAGLLLALVLGSFGAVRWTLATEAGARWLLARLPGVEATGVQGALLGGPEGRLGIKQLRIRWDEGQASLTLDDVLAEGLRWRFRPPDAAPGTWVALDMDRLSVRQATYISGPPSGQPLVAPASLALPLQLNLRLAEVGTLKVDAQAPATALRAEGLVLDSRPGASHSVQALQGQWQGLAIQGSAQLAHAPPFATMAQAALHPVADGDSPAWGAALRASGPLERLAVQATLRGVPRSGKPAPSVDLRGDLLPFQAWPVGELDLRTTALDLAALHASAPETRLDARARVRSRALHEPVSAEAAITNALPGRWNEGRLPMTRLNLDLAGRIDQLDRLDVSRFELDLADALRPAGRWTGQARWQGHQLTLDTRLVEVVPQRLDGRAAAMRLSGPLALEVNGLPSPDPGATGTVPPWAAKLRTALDGTLDAAPQPVSLKLTAEADANRLEIMQVQAQTGSARAEGQARLQRRSPGSPWQLVTQGSLAQFDPLPWLQGGSGSEGEAWRRGPHRLSGQWQLDVRLPADAERLAPLAIGPRLAGNGRVQLVDSVLAGLPAQADVTLGYAPGAGTLKARVQVADAVFTAEGRGDPAGDGVADQWQADLQADALAALAPLARIVPGLAEWAPTQGGARLQISGTGRWPALRSEGHAQVQQLQAGSLKVAQGQFDWRFDTGPEEPLSLTLDVSGLQLGKQRADQLRGTVRGRLAEHRIDLEAMLPMLPPPAAAAVLGLPATASAAASGAAGPAAAAARPARNGTRAQLLAQGTWSPADAGGGLWRADIDRLAVGGWDGRPLPPVPATGTASTAPPLTGPTWADGRELDAELQFDAAGSLVALRASAGRIRLAETASLRWDAIRIDLQAQPVRVELNAAVDPFAVAPLLARLQPEMGWAGDLQLGARIQVRADERFEADVLVERSSGDLAAGGNGGSAGPASTAGGTGTGAAAMGLSELRLALRASEGNWAFQADAAGALIGEIRGQLQARTAATARWPGADAPVSGRLQLRVADIGIWNAWVPPGWRISGQLQGLATVDGQFGAPRYTGELSGSKLGLRNLLQGVNVGDGEVMIRLAGDNAVIERFALRAGEGTLTISGDANLGATPRALLKLQAERFRVLGRVDRQLITSGQAQLELNKGSARLDGRIVVDEGLFDISRGDAPSLDDDVNVRLAGQPEPVPKEASADAPRRNVVVNLDLDLGRQLRLRGRGLDTLLRGQLKLTSPGGRLAANGSINAEDGSYTGYGQKMTIERGIIAFSGDIQQPRLDVLAIRPNLDIRVGVAITGPLGAMRIRLVSEPELSENDKLSWLLLGREPDSLGRADTALLQRAAVALLAGEGEAPTETLLRNLGIDELSLRQTDGDVRETVITLGKQLSRRWYLGYERGVNSTTGTWQLIYRIAQRFTLRAQSGLENSLDLIWIWRLGETPGFTERPDGSALAPAAVRKSVSTPP